MKKISENIQGGVLFARKVGSGEVGIVRASGKRFMAAIYWNSKQDALDSLEALVHYFKSDEDE